MITKVGGGKLVDYQDHLSKWLRGELVGPLTVEVGATFGCNHACLHCGFQQFEKWYNQKDYIHSEAFEQFMIDFHELGGVEVYFAGNGEPLLNPHLPRWMEYGARLGLTMTVSTNGIPLVPAKQRTVLPNGKWIRFSVNGGTPETYAHVHQCNLKEFDLLRNNLLAAVHYKKEHNLDVKLIIQFVVYHLNWHTLHEIAAFHKEVGTDLLIFRNVAMEDGSHAVIPHEIENTLHELDVLPQVCVRWETFERPTHEFPWSKCYGIHFRTNMDTKGNLIACNRQMIQESIYGNIHEKRFPEIWESFQKQRLFSIIEKGQTVPRCGKWCQTSQDNVFLETYLHENEI